MPLVLFVPAIPLPLPLRHAHVLVNPIRLPSTRRAALVRPRCTATLPQPPANDDPSANPPAEALPTPVDPPPRPAPQWVFPDGDPRDVGDDNPWVAWEAAKVSEDLSAPPPPRDPKAETDFWRSTARDLVTVDPQHPPTDPPAPQPDDDPSAVWAQARDVTGEVSSLQDRLRSELDRYDPDQNVDSYRTIARQLVGPDAQTWDPLNNTTLTNNANDNEEHDSNHDDQSNDNEYVRPDEFDDVPTGDAEAGSGWNPDVDWMRFEDMPRVREMIAQREARQAVEDAAAQARDAAQRPADPSGMESGPPSVDAASEGGSTDDERETSGATEWTAPAWATDLNTSAGESVSSTEEWTPPPWATAADSQAPPLDNGGDMPAELPGFLKNRMRSSSIYGPDWAGSADEVELLEARGETLRDPKADTDAWRSVARELADIATNAAEVDGGMKMEEDIVEEVASDGTDDVDSVVREIATEDTVLTSEDFQREDEAARETTDDNPSLQEDASDAWASWRNSAMSWAADNQETVERDAQAEVDMWRSSARELTGGEKSEAVGSMGRTNDRNTPEASAWDEWRAADARWQKSVEKADAAGWESDSSAERWMGENENSRDWGAGLGRLNSERAAWDDWNRVSGVSRGGDSNLWWSTRSEAPMSRDNEPFTVQRSEPDPFEVPAPTRQSPTVRNVGKSTSSDVRLETDSSVGSWLNIAKELTGGNAAADVVETPEGRAESEDEETQD